MIEEILNAILTHLTGFVVAGVVAWCGHIFRAIQKQRRDTEILKDGIKALLGEKIEEHYNIYVKAGYIPGQEKARVLRIYNAYKALNGNGVIRGYVEQLERLPNIAPQEVKNVTKN